GQPGDGKHEQYPARGDEEGEHVHGALPGEQRNEQQQPDDESDLGEGAHLFRTGEWRDLSVPAVRKTGPAACGHHTGKGAARHPATWQPQRVDPRIPPPLTPMNKRSTHPAATETGDPYLLTPGPLTTSATVKHAMQHDLGSRDDSFIERTGR